MAKRHTSDFTPNMEDLREELRLARQALQAAYDQFNYADDPVLVEACIYEIKATQARYDYLLRRIKLLSGRPVALRHATISAASPCVAASATKGGNICPS